jgi:hypothetical protein
LNALGEVKREDGTVEDGEESGTEREEELEDGELEAEDFDVKTEPTGEGGETEQCNSAETSTRKRQRRSNKNLVRPAKKNRYVDSEVTESETEDGDCDFSVRPESLSDTTSSSSECDTDCNNSSSSSSSSDNTSSSNTSVDDDEEDREGFTCNFETQRFQQDAQEFL